MKNENNSSSPIVPIPTVRENACEDMMTDEYLDENKNFFLPLLKRQAIKSAPSYSLFEILPKMNVDSLRHIYRAHILKPAAGKLKKQELIDALLPILTDEHELELFIKMLPDREWIFFHEALREKELRDDQGMIYGAQAALSEGYACLFYHQTEFTYVVPDEVKETFKKIDKPDLHQYMEVRLWLNLIACAAVNLYGALSLEELAEIINKQNKIKGKELVTPDILEYLLSGYDYYNDDYRISDGYIAAYDFADADDTYLDMAEVRGLLGVRKGKPRYLPDIETFLYYSDPDYYDQTPHIKALNKALRAMGLSSDDAQNLLDTLHFKIAAEEDVPKVLEALEECGVTLESDHADKILQLIMKVFNSTRLWRNYGHTPDEIMKIMGREQPRAIHFGPGIEKMFLSGELKIGDLERSLMGGPLINDDLKDSFISEVARMKKLMASGSLPEAKSNEVPLRKPGRNDPCPCGSGLKYKKCCGKNAGNLG